MNVSTINNGIQEVMQTSAIVIIVDTQREVDIGLGPRFSQTVLGK